MKKHLFRIIFLVFVGFGMVAIAGSVFVLNILQEIETGLPLNILSQHRGITSLIQSNSNLLNALKTIEVDPSDKNLDELTLALDLADYTLKLYEKDEKIDQIEQMAGISLEFRDILDDIDELVMYAPPLNLVTAGYLSLRLTNALDLMRNVYVQTSKDTHIALSVQARQLKRLHLGTIFIIFLIAASLCVMVVLIIVQYKSITLLRAARTNLKEAKEIAEEATRSKSDFLANMSHEIRTPMNAIIGMNYLMSQTELNSKQKDYLKKIQTSSQSLLGIINDILDFSKIEAGKMEMESVEFDLNDVMDHLTNLISVKTREKKAFEVHFATDQDVPKRLVGDPLRLGQILINLTNNALKFTEQGEIVISTRLVHKERDRARLEFSVKDTGIGMSPEQTQNLFQPFTQADTSTTRKYGGTGLGLTICQNLVGLMDGHIEAKSHLGQGSTFTFTAAFGLGRRQEKKMFEPSPDLRGMRVLVVDDNATSRQILKKILESFTFYVTLAESGEAGLNHVHLAAKDQSFDLVIMDWQMPGMNGIEASRQIKQSKVLPLIPPILMVTSFSSGNIMEQAESVGIDGFLLKPVTPSSLLNSIMQIFDKQPTEISAPETPHRISVEALKPIWGSKILLAEDNEINQQVACEILEQSGFDVQVANNGQESVNMVKATEYDLVLMDIQMPVMDGYQAVHEIRRHDRFKTLPILAMTAHAMAGDKDKSIQAGMNDHITKPINPDQLFAALLKYIKPGQRDISKDLREKMITAVPDKKTASLKNMPGIEVSSGLSRLGGNKGLYLEILVKFRRDYADAAEEFKQLLETRDYDTAQRLAHSIKGVSGNIGALDVQKAAAGLELAFKEQDLDPLDGMINKFKTFLSTALESIQILLSTRDAKTQAQVEAKPGDPAALLGQLERLKPYVTGREAKPAKQLTKEMAGAAWPEDLNTAVNDLAACVSRYKFKQAQAILEELIIQLNRE